MIVIQAENQKEIKDDSDEEGNIALPNDEDDPAEDAKLYALWKIRELKRLKRDHDERTLREREKAEIERRRRLTD
jgi:microfibrillar-associated protein 1